MMSPAIHANTKDGRAVYKLKRQSKDQFQVQLDWDKSQARHGGFGLTFNPQDELEVRGFADHSEWNIQVAPDGYDSSVLILPPPNGMRGANAPASFNRIDFDAPIAKEQSRKVALQVASSLIQVPFLEQMLEQPIPASKT